MLDLGNLGDAGAPGGGDLLLAQAELAAASTMVAISFRPGALMRNFGGRWQKAAHTFREQFQTPGPNMVLDQEPVVIRCDRSRPAADVVLDPEAQQVLAPTWSKPLPDFSEIFVLLAKGGGEQIEIYINEHRLGTLTGADSAEFMAVLAAADGQPVTSEAIRDRSQDGGWALHVYRPETE